MDDRFSALRPPLFPWANLICRRTQVELWHWLPHWFCVVAFSRYIPADGPLELCPFWSDTETREIWVNSYLWARSHSPCPAFSRSDISSSALCGRDIFSVAVDDQSLVQVTRLISTEFRVQRPTFIVHSGRAGVIVLPHLGMWMDSVNENLYKV